jgi:hypothetical protein
MIANLGLADTKEMEERLGAAVAACRKGREDKLGVLITRHAFDHFPIP